MMCHKILCQKQTNKNHRKPNNKKVILGFFLVALSETRCHSHGVSFANVSMLKQFGYKDDCRRSAKWKQVFCFGGRNQQCIMRVLS